MINNEPNQLVNNNLNKVWEGYFLNEWSKNQGNEQTKLFAHYFLNTVRLPKNAKSLLDVGCAMGEALEEIHNRYPHLQLYGCDISSLAIEKARKKYGGIATFKICSLENIKGYYDMIYCSNTLEHVKNYLEVASEFLNHCQWLYILVPYKESNDEKSPMIKPYIQHVSTFDKHSFDPLLTQDNAVKIRKWVRHTPGAWGTGPVPFWRKLEAQLLVKSLPIEFRQIFFEITASRKLNSSKPIIRWATLGDMRGSQFRKVFLDLEDNQSNFYSVQDKVNGKPYAWPLRPLYEWSRRVEYPFVVSELPQKKRLRVLDAGSGVTFFPIYLAQVPGMYVECLDREQSYVERMEQTCNLLGLSWSIPFHLGDLTKELPFNDGSFDVVLCISVLEHLPVVRQLEAVNELWRLVAPRGKLILTFDVCLAGDEDGGISLPEVEYFLSKLAELVGPLPSLSNPRLRDLLTPQNPGYGLAPIRVGEKIVRFGPESILLRLRDIPLPAHKHLACLKCSITKL